MAKRKRAADAAAPEPSAAAHDDSTIEACMLTMVTERGVDKTRWVSDQSFKPAVPSNRLADQAGMNEKSRMAMSGSYIPAA